LLMTRLRKTTAKLIRWKKRVALATARTKASLGLLIFGAAATRPFSWNKNLRPGFHGKGHASQAARPPARKACVIPASGGASPPQGRRRRSSHYQNIWRRAANPNASRAFII
jgi:hypothetical protein